MDSYRYTIADKIHLFGVIMSSIFRAKRVDDEIKPTRKYSSAQEKAVAESVKGKTTKNSGATMFQKGDILTDNWLLECKTCTKHQKQFTIKKDWIEKNKQESLFMNKDYSAVVFNFGPDENNYYVIDELTFKELLEYQEKRGR